MLVGLAWWAQRVAGWVGDLGAGLRLVSGQVWRTRMRVGLLVTWEVAQRRVLEVVWPVGMGVGSLMA